MAGRGGVAFGFHLVAVGALVLFDSVVLATSVAITPVAEAFSVPEIYSAIVIRSEPAEPTAADSGTGVSSVAARPTTRVPLAQVAGLTGIDLLGQLSLLDADELGSFAATHPATIESLRTAPPSPRDVGTWWTGLDPDGQTVILTTAPWIVGNLEGMPFGVRDTANRNTLLDTIVGIDSAQQAGRAQLLDDRRELEMLRQVQLALEAPAGAPQRYLLTFDAANGGVASIVIGDLSSADYVSLLVPGMFYSVDSKLVDWAAAAQTFYDTENDWIDRLGATNPSLADATVATVAWIGYRTPSMVNFTSLDLAYQGRDAIAATIEGIHALRRDNPPTLSIISHSYGTTAAMLALSELHIQVDAIALVGSPGSPASTASDLGVAGDNVYVGEADWDQVKDTAFFGTDPGSAAFGAHHFAVAGGFDPLRDEVELGSTGHDEYFVPGSESLNSLALIALGEGYRVTAPDGYATVARGISGFAHEH
jgi:hypothetical protein